MDKFALALISDFGSLAVITDIAGNLPKCLEPYRAVSLSRRMTESHCSTLQDRWRHPA